MSKKARLAQASSDLDLASLIASSRCPEARVKAILENLNLVERGSAADRSFRRDVSQLHDKILGKVTRNLEFPVDGRNIPESLPCAKLGEIIAMFAEECPAFEKLLLKCCFRIQRRLQLCIYADEVTPGDIFKPDHLRKAVLLYATLLNFDEFLGSKYSWLPVFVAKHSLVEAIPGGLSRIFRDIFRFWKDSPIFQHGHMLVLPESGKTLYLKIVPKLFTIEDYAASSSTWSSKTASGTVPCIWCANVVLTTSELHLHDQWAVPISCFEPERFQEREEADYREIASLLEDAKSTSAGALIDSEKAHGFVFHPASCIAGFYCFLSVCGEGLIQRTLCIPKVAKSQCQTRKACCKQRTFLTLALQAQRDAYLTVCTISGHLGASSASGIYL